jgi:hypothetical protein
VLDIQFQQSFILPCQNHMLPCNTRTDVCPPEFANKTHSNTWNYTPIHTSTLDQFALTFFSIHWDRPLCCSIKKAKGKTKPGECRKAYVTNFGSMLCSISYYQVTNKSASSCPHITCIHLQQMHVRTFYKAYVSFNQEKKVAGIFTAPKKTEMIII